MINADKPGGLPDIPKTVWDLRPAVSIIMEFEGCFLKAYRDPVGVLTIGYGHTDGVYEGQEISSDRAIELLMSDIDLFSKGVDNLVKVLLTNSERCALISFSFNVGLGALSKSTLLAKLNNGDTIGAADQFLLWNHAGGKVLPGLTRRREAERDLFLRQDTILA